MNKSKYTKNGLIELINAIPLAIIVIGEDAKIRLVNGAMRGFINKLDDQLVGLYSGQAFDCKYLEDDTLICGSEPRCKVCDIRNLILSAIKNGEHVTKKEIPFTIKGGINKIFQISTKRINIDDKINILVTLEDITIVKRQAHDILENEKLQTAIHTTSSITHELSQPLMILNGNIGMLISDIKGAPMDIMVDASDINYKRIDTILENLTRLNAITHKLQHITAVKLIEYLNGNILDINSSSVSNQDYDQ